MKILQVTEAFGGGVLDSVVSICNATASVPGADVHLCFGRREQTPDDLSGLLDPRVVLHELPRGGPPILRDIESVRIIQRVMQEARPEVVHLHSSKAGFYGRLAAVLAGGDMRVFYTPQGWSFLRRDTSPATRSVFRFLERLGRTFGGTVLGCCQGEADLTPPPLFGAGGEIRAIDNAVFGDFSSYRSSDRDHRERPRIQVGILGRVAPQRDPPFFLEMVGLLRDDPVDFLWIGGGQEEAVARLEAAGVTVTGWLPQAEALAQLASLDVYVHTSAWEGMPIAVLQAMAVGLPVVVRNVVGNRDAVIDSETGFVCDTPGQIAAALRDLAGDETLRRRLGSAAAEAALARFSEGRYRREILALYGLDGALVPDVSPA